MARRARLNLKRLDPDTERETKRRLNEVLAIVAKARPDLVEAIAAGRPIGFALIPEPVPATLAITDWRAYLARGDAARRGKPVPYALHVPDGSPPVTVEVADPLPPPPRKGRAPGRPPHWFTLDRYVRLPAADKALTDGALARKLTAETGRPVTKALVGARRREGARRRARRGSKRPPAAPAS